MSDVRMEKGPARLARSSGPIKMSKSFVTRAQIAGCVNTLREGNSSAPTERSVTDANIELLATSAQFRQLPLLLGGFHREHHLASLVADEMRLSL